MENDLSSLQTLLLAIGVLVVLLSVVLYKFRIVKTEERIRKVPFVCGLVILALGISMPPLLRWLGYI